MSVEHYPSEVPERNDITFPYRVRDNFLSTDEIRFYQDLVFAVGGHYVVAPKVRLADIFYVTQRFNNYAPFNRIAMKHVDFLLCEPHSMKPALAIELDDHSHNRPDRVARDEFIDQLFTVAGLRLVHVPIRRNYDVWRLRDFLFK